MVDLDGWTSEPLDVTPGASNLPDLYAWMTNPIDIDVLAFYTPAVAKQSADIEQTLVDLLLQANTAYANSDTNVRLRTVGLELANYKESGSISRDLTRLASPGDGALDQAAKQRNVTHADAVLLLTSGAKTFGNTIGLAYEFDPGSDDKGHAAWAFGAVALQSATSTGWDEDFVADDIDTVAHEVGHILGAGHETAQLKPGEKDSAPEPYAHGYEYTGTDDKLYHDVMAYGSIGSTAIPFFSTPDFTYKGKPIGNATTADNARAIREFAPAVSNYRQAVGDGNYDLTATITGVRFPTFALPGATGTVLVQVNNLGTTALTNAPISISVSREPAGGEAYVFASSTLSLSIPAGGSVTAELPITVPSDEVGNTSNFVASLDLLNVVQETNETNNTSAAFAFTVEEPVVLIATSMVLPDELNVGKQGKTQITLEHTGNIKAKFTYRVRLTIADSSVVTKKSTVTLSPGGTKTFTVKFKTKGLTAGSLPVHVDIETVKGPAIGSLSFDPTQLDGNVQLV